MPRKRKKKNLTTKNTHIKGAREKGIKDDKISTGTRVAAIIVLLMGLYLIIMKACDNRVTGYDHWLGMPWIWI